MTRVDINTADWQGFVIFDNRGPFQAMYRLHGFIRYGNDNGVYWLRSVDGTATDGMAEFIEFVYDWLERDATKP